MARAPVPVLLRVELGSRLDEPLEVAAYYVVAESLANLGKHAQAASATVDIWRSPGEVVVEVADDGVGGADTERGTGLRGLADRVEALGGPASGLESVRRWDTSQGGAPVRVMIAEDSVLLREGLARILGEAGLEVVGQCGDADELLLKVAAIRPTSRSSTSGCPRPTRTRVQAALEIRASHPSVGAGALPVHGARAGDEAPVRIRRGCRLPCSRIGSATSRSSSPP